MNGTPLLIHYLYMLFIAMLKHGDALNCVSIQKEMNKNTGEIKDYRGITLSSVLGTGHCLLSSQEIYSAILFCNSPISRMYQLFSVCLLFKT